MGDIARLVGRPNRNRPILARDWARLSWAVGELLAGDLIPPTAYRHWERLRAALADRITDDDWDAVRRELHRTGEED